MTTTTPEQVFVDVLIIGAGGAGLRAAAEAANTGLNVLVLSKVPPLRSHTVAAQGGMNAALGNVVADDWRWHAYDTIKGADWLADQDAVAMMCEEASAAIIELEHLGMTFSRLANGSIYQRAYGGQNTEYGKGSLAYRACTVADRTGHALMYTLHGLALKHHVRFLQDAMAIDLLKANDGAICGALVWEFETGSLLQINAKCTIIASGGYGQAWQSTTSSVICTGDGNAMALRAGAALQDMEFVQFHPTSLYGAGVLISEGARGEGAHLLNGLGERFMERYAPSSMELTSRDVISRAIMQEIAAGRGAGEKKDHVLLSLTHLNATHIKTMLPNVCDVAHTFARIDALSAPIPVLPAVHYTMGGVASNVDCDVMSKNTTNHTFESMQGLLVVGEAACNSVHGANRLGCNSLLDLVIFGKRAGQSALAIAAKQSHAAPTKLSIDNAYARLAHAQFARADGKTLARRMKAELQQMMHTHASMFRSGDCLESGLRKLEDLKQIFAQDLKPAGRSLIWNSDALDALETENLLQQAECVLRSAIAREESRGAHFRDDFPTRNDAQFLAHSTCQLSSDGNIQTSMREVVMESKAHQLHFPPEARTY
jgi:succinate dehydrogenase / fumarate reductase flavoprotein subunit